MQNLQVTVAIPPDYILVEKVKYDELNDQNLIGRQWSMDDLKEATNHSAEWLKVNVLYPHRDELDVLNGGFVRYPLAKGQPWRFGAKRMSDWLEEHLEEVLKWRNR